MPCASTNADKPTPRSDVDADDSERSIHVKALVLMFHTPATYGLNEVPGTGTRPQLLLPTALAVTEGMVWLNPATCTCICALVLVLVITLLACQDTCDHRRLSKLANHYAPMCCSTTSMLDSILRWREHPKWLTLAEIRPVKRSNTCTALFEHRYFASCKHSS